MGIPRPIIPPPSERYPEDNRYLPDRRIPLDTNGRYPPPDDRYPPSRQPPPGRNQYEGRYPDVRPEYPPVSGNRYPVSENRFPVGNSRNPVYIYKYGNGDKSGNGP